MNIPETGQNSSVGLNSGAYIAFALPNAPRSTNVGQQQDGVAKCSADLSVRPAGQA